MREISPEKKLNFLFSFLAIAVMWGAWLIAYAAVGNDYILPSFSDTMKEMGRLFGESLFWRSLGSTFLRSLEGWVLAFAVALVFASLSALSDKLRCFLGTFVAVMRTVPTLAITLMLLLWSTPHTAPVIVTFLMLFPVSYAQMMSAYRAIDPKLAEMAVVYGISRRDRIFRIYVPQMLPSLFSQAGPNLSLSLKVCVSAEVLAYTYIAIGGMLKEANSYLQISRMFALTLSVLIVGGLVELALGFLTRITDRWTHGRAQKEVRR